MKNLFSFFCFFIILFGAAKVQAQTPNCSTITNVYVVFQNSLFYANYPYCPNSPLILSLTMSYPRDTNLTYQWQKSPDSINYVSLVNDTLGVDTITQNATTFYRCVIGCRFNSSFYTTPATKILTDNKPGPCYSDAIPWYDVGQDIFGVKLGTINNTSTCTSATASPFSLQNRYSDFVSSLPDTFNIGQTYSIKIDLGWCKGDTSNNYGFTNEDFRGDDVKASLDFNHDGDFSDTGEVIFTNSLHPPVLYSNGDYYTNYNTLFYSNLSRVGLATITNGALTGNTRLRIEVANYGWRNIGEIEDYNINLQAPPLTFLFCNAIQKMDSVTHGTKNKAILRVPVAVTGAGYSTITEMLFNTLGTTNTLNIDNVKLYRTDTSKTFNTSKLLATIANPTATTISFVINDTLLSYDTTNYWLAYDINQNTPVGEIFDAKFVTVKVNGSYQTPLVSSPSGNIKVIAPKTLVGVTTKQNIEATVHESTANNKILSIEITTSNAGAPVYLNSINISTNGTTDTTEIRNLKIWYTGNNNTFDTSMRYGSTVAYPKSLQSISSNLFLPSGTNYFWVTYDLPHLTSGGNFIDAECTSISFDGNTQIPIVTAPAGNRKIITDYCFSEVYDASGDKIVFVKIGLLSNNSFGCNSRNIYGGTCNMCATYYGNYSDFTKLPVATLYTGITYPININIWKQTYQYNYNGYVSIYTDLNQDGDFVDTGETIFSGTANDTSIFNYKYVFGNVSIPSSALKGITRLRVVYSKGTSAPVCYFAYDSKEAEDYTIIIKDDTLECLGSKAIQSKGAAWTGTSNNKVLRVPITMGGSGVAMANKLYFSTKGTNHTSNISAAKLYRTENRANFDTSHLVASIINPNGAMVFSMNDTLLNNDTTNYWLTYDVKPNAILLDTLDATFDSLEVLGTIQKPTESNPSGNLIINTPMKFLNATTTQNVVKRVYPNTAKLNVLGIVVNTSSVGIPFAIDSLAISTNGTTNLADITNLRVWYTGNTNVFDTTFQYGATVNLPSQTQSIKRNMLLANGANYFWVTYDVKSSAIISNLIDAECTSIGIDGSLKTPTVTAPAGNIRIRTDYCYSSAQITNSQEIMNVKLGDLNNVSSCVSITPGVGSVDRLYSNFTALPAATFYKGISYNLAVTINSCNAVFGSEVVAAYIDYNQDGLFTGLGENVYTSAYTTGSANQVRGGEIIIPNNADTGMTRLRIVYSQNISAPSCGAYSNGETEDYSINLQECPVYFWTGAASTDFTSPANWQPNRNTVLAVDKLVFSNGGNISVTNVQNQSISSLTIDSNSQVNMAASGINVLSISDTLFLTSGAIIGSSNLTLSIGTDTVKTGTLIGNGAFKDGTMRRWINKNMGDIIFPIYSGTNNRSIKINYTTQPNISGYLKAQFITTKPINNGLPLNESGIVVKRAGINGYWALTATTLSGGIFTSTLNGDGFNGITDPTKLVLLRRATNASVWQLHGSHVAAYGSNSSPIVSRTGMSSYGNFGIGGDTLVNSLPVSMLNFAVKKVNENAMLTWATSSEQNNAGFEIEKNTDFNKNYEWQSIGFVKGNGTTNVIHNYQFEDFLGNDLIANRTSLYYRLKQTDFNGNYYFSKIISLPLSSDDEDIKVYPNPFDDEININLANSLGLDSKIELFNCLGDAIPVSVVANKYTSNTLTLQNLSYLPNGVYFLKINNKMIKVIR